MSAPAAPHFRGFEHGALKRDPHGPLDAVTQNRSLRFNERERRYLLASRGLGPVVVGRLEQFGIASIDTMRALGVDAVVQTLCDPSHNGAWLNRRRALLQAINLFG
jgi:hypothetical protein